MKTITADEIDTVNKQINIEETRKKQFKTLFFIEIWERYAFYSFQCIFMLYIAHLNFSSQKAYLIFGIFSAILYIAPTLGGRIADQLLGHHRSLIIGALIFSLGYLILSYSNSENSVYIALSIIAIGNGFFKPMPSTMISNIYNKDPAKSKSAFTYYYMAIQIGGFFAMILSP
jgi:POT family proton-dependent oligopeptide transporter